MAWRCGALSLCSLFVHVCRLLQQTALLKRHVYVNILTEMSSLLRILPIIFSIFVTNTLSSPGDRSPFYGLCVEKCNLKSCKIDGDFKRYPSFELQLLLWSCRDNCSYSCMWETVTYFTTHGLEVPQFHGKWPFIRIFGLQEPASVLFSMFNFFAHVTMFNKFRKNLNSSTPLFYMWTYFMIICTHGWLWSAVFHARDKYFTEVMDYSCAFTTVLTLFYCLLIRISYKYPMNIRIFSAITCVYISTLLAHLAHLWSGRINYGYNMKFNIAIGFLTFSITMIWWYRNHRKFPHAYFIGWFTILTVAVTLLEVADFPPIFWIFDAHSLWHAATVPLVSLFYRFITLDSFYLKNQYLKLDGEHLL